MTELLEVRSQRETKEALLCCFMGGETKGRVRLVVLFRLVLADLAPEQGDGNFCLSLPPYHNTN